MIAIKFRFVTEHISVTTLCKMIGVFTLDIENDVVRNLAFFLYIIRIINLQQTVIL